MTTEPRSHIIRTTGGRMAKGIAIIIIVMAVGAAIHIAFEDVWVKYPPNRVLLQQEQQRAAPPTETIPPGKEITINMAFKESADLVNLWFEVNGEKNPDIVVNLGDKVTINIVNEGVMPHAFGVVTNPDDVNSVVFNSAIGSASSPLAPGESKSVTFTVTQVGEFYYICLVPGHALQGMQGNFIVEEAGASAETGATSEEAAITGEGSLTINMAFKESADLVNLWFEVNGQKNPTIKVKAGTQVTINIVNEGVMPHAFGVVTNPDDVNSVVFNSAIGSASSPVLAGKNGSITFTADTPGTYYYICLVPGHTLQGMKGNFIVE
ncbi:MAG: hypothetical protein KatS3mg003_1200 [Candidatus Nitrosocaldaceae archaeon]|nr:MAG: hypothetical protein KatS3mg003_1200 [Candidatus Nitrosocaldaceae archaeon]